MNKVILIGRLANSPELRFGMSGAAVTRFTLAVDRYRGKEKEADFINIVTFGKTAEICGNNLDKGRKVAVEGRIQTRSYETKNGRRYVTEVVANTVEFLDSPKKGDAYEDEIDGEFPDFPEDEELDDSPF